MPTIWWNPFRSERVALRATHSPEECLAIIQSNIFRFWTLSDTSAPFVGRVRENRFTLSRNIRGTFLDSAQRQNPLGPIVHGVALPESGGGANLTIRLSLPLATRQVVVFFAAAALLFALYNVVGLLRMPSLSTGLLGLIEGLLPGAILYAVYVVGSWLSRDERDFLIVTLRRLLDATLTSQE